MKKFLLFFLVAYSVHYIPTEVTAQKPVNMSAVCGTASSQVPNGRFEIFTGIHGNRGGVYHTWQLAGGGGWEPTWTVYSPAPDDNPNGLVAGKDGNGRMIVAWITNGNIHMAQARHKDASLINSPEPAFRPAGEADGRIYKYTQLRLVNNSDGMVEILALNERGRVYSLKQVTQDETKGYWTWKARELNGQILKPGPILIGGGDLQHISVTNFKGRLALIGTGKDGKVYLKNQTVPGTWDQDPWINLGGNKIKAAYVQVSKDNQLEVVAMGSDGSLYLKYQNVGNTNWSAWQLLLDHRTNGKFAPSIFFERFKDGSLFVVAHKETNNDQFIGGFGKTFQSANNGAWSGIYYSYNAVTTHQAGVNTQDYLGFLSPKAFALAKDVNGVIHYFSCYRILPRVEHYIDYSGASSSRSLAYERREHEIPNFPWATNQR